MTLDEQGNVIVDNPDALGSPGAISLTGTTDGIDGIVTGLASTAQLTAGMPVTGAGVAAGTTILTVNSATSVTLSSIPTAGTPLLTFNGGTQLVFFNSMVAGVSQFNLTFGNSTTAVPLTYQGVAATDALDIQNALQGLASIGGAFVTVTPEESGSFLLTFSGPLANTQLLATVTIANSTVNGLLGSAVTEVAGGTVVANGAALELESSLSLEPITLNGNGIQPPFNGHYTGALENVSNANTYTGTLTLATNSTIGVTAGQLTIVSANADGIVDGGTAATAYGLDKEGNGTLVLASPDSYQGGTTVTVGALELQDSDALGAVILTGTTNTSNGLVTGLASTAALAAGMPVSGVGIPSGTTIAMVNSATSVTLSNTPTLAGSPALTFAFTSSTFVSDGAQLQVAAAGPPTLTGATLAAGTGLNLGTTYYYVVTAVNANGDESAVSNQLSAKPTTAGTQQVTLTWNPVAGAVSYNVYRSTTSGNFTSGLVASGITLTTYTDTGLSTLPVTPGGINVLGQHLYLTGSGLANNGALANLAGNNTWAGLVTLSTVAAYSVTSAPEGVVAVYVDPTNTLTLSNNINEGPPIATPLQNTPVGVTGLGLAAGTYYYVVTATNAYGESLVSNQEVNTPAGGQNQVMLSWAQVYGATGYNIYRSTSAGNFTNALLKTISSGSTTSFTDGGGTTVAGTPNTAAPSGLAEIGTGTLVLAGNNSFTGGTYIGYVFGNVNDSGTVAPSLVGSGGVNGGVIDVQNSNALGNNQGNEIQRVTTSEPPNTKAGNATTFNLSFNGVPTANLPFGSSAAVVQAALNGLSTIDANGGSVSVSESAVQTGLDEVQTVTLTNPTSALNAPTGLGLAAAAGGNLTPVTTYYYEVTAVIPALGESVPSAQQSLTTSTALNDNLGVTLTWTPVAGATSYKIYRSTVSGDFNQAYLTTVTGTSYLDAGPSAALTAPTFVPLTSSSITVGGSLPLATYNYVITSIGPAGESAVSANLVAVVSTAGSQEVHLSWAVVPGATGYRIYRSTSFNYTNSLIATIASGATTSFADLGLVPATFSPPVQTQYSLQFSVTLNGTTTNLAPNQNIITALASTSQLTAGMLVSGTGIPAGTVISSILGATSVKISNNATAAATSPITFTAVTPNLSYLGVGGTGAGSDAVNIQSALQLLTPIGANNVIVTPDATDTIFTITFVGALTDTPQSTIAPVAGLGLNGVTTIASNSITGLLSTSQLVPGMLVSGTGIPTGSTIVAINSTSAITISASATATGAATLTFVEPTTSAAGAETTPGDGGTSYIYTVQFNGTPLNSSAQPLLVVTANSTELTVGASETATGGVGALVYNGAALQVDGDPGEIGASISLPAGETLALNGNGPAGGGSLVNVSGANTWQGNVILQSSSTVAAAATTQLTVIGLVQDAPPSAANPVPTSPPASVTKVGAGAVSLAPATQVINLTHAVSTLNEPTLNAPVYSNGGAINATYFYEVTAIGPNGETLPGAPRSTAIGALTNQIVNLTWTNNPAAFAATGYRIYRATALGGPYHLLANIDSGATLTYQDNGLTTPSATVTPPAQTQFNLALGAFPIGPITYTGASALGATIQTQLQTVLTAHFAGVTANVTALNANTFTVTYSDIGNPAALANVPPLTASIVPGTAGNIAINTNTFSGDVYDNAGVLNIQSAQALGLSTSAVEEISVSGSSGSFQLTFNGQTTGPLQYGLPASGGASATASVQNALNALSSISSINPYGVTVTQVGNNYYVYFNGAGLANQYQNPITYVKPLSAGISSIVITHPLAGGATNVDVANGAALQTQSGTTAQAFSENSGKYLTIAGSGFNGNGALENVSGTNAWGATPITLGTNPAAIGADTGSTLNLNKPITDSFLTPTIQFNNFTAGATPDTYSLSYGGAVTGILSYTGVAGTGPGSDGAVILAALQSLSSVVPLGGTVQVTSLGAHSYKVIFSNTLYGTFAPGIGSIPITSANGSFQTPVPPATSDNYGVNKVGAGIVSYNVGNTYTGLTNVVAGTLKLNNSTAPGSGLRCRATCKSATPRWCRRCRR